MHLTAHVQEKKKKKKINGEGEEGSETNTWVDDFTGLILVTVISCK